MSQLFTAVNNEDLVLVSVQLKLLNEFLKQRYVPEDFCLNLFAFEGCGLILKPLNADKSRFNPRSAHSIITRTFEAAIKGIKTPPMRIAKITDRNNTFEQVRVHPFKFIRRNSNGVIVAERISHERLVEEIKAVA